MARRLGIYAKLPAKIFGRTCPQHRASHVREVLDYYNKPCRAKASKVQLLQQLTAVQNEIKDEEKATITKWLKGGFGFDSLAKSLGKPSKQRDVGTQEPRIKLESSVEFEY
jgi:hypothetical protein